LYYNASSVGREETVKKHFYRQTNRSAKEAAKLRADRDRYQRDKPSPEQLLKEGGHRDFVPLGELILIHQVMASLKRERIRQGLTLADIAKRTGIDPTALSKLETGRLNNPTLQTLHRIALSLGKAISCSLQDNAPKKTVKRPSVRAR
jgi:DNA-binding XRE family transcriptional regulator